MCYILYHSRIFKLWTLKLWKRRLQRRLARAHHRKVRKFNFLVISSFYQHKWVSFFEIITYSNWTRVDLTVRMVINCWANLKHKQFRLVISNCIKSEGWYINKTLFHGSWLIRSNFCESIRFDSCGSASRREAPLRKYWDLTCFIESGRCRCHVFRYYEKVHYQ